MYPRQNKIYLFEVMAVLFGGSRSWCDVGTWLWGPFPNPVLVAKQLPNVAFWLADVAQFPVQIIEILSLKDADKCEQLLSRCYKHFAIVRKKKYLEKYENPSYCMKLLKLQQDIKGNLPVERMPWRHV